MHVAVTHSPLLGGLRAAYLEESAWQQLSACPVCATAAHLVTVGVVEAQVRGLVTTTCTDCAVVFLSRRPSTSWFDRFYADSWDSSGRQKGVKKRRTNRKVADFCGDQLPESARVLEVGLGFGAELLAFRERGHTVQGVERSRHRAQHVEETVGIPCAFGALEDLDLPGDWDLVYSNHVLEHTDDPAASIERQAALLGERGMLYVAVPDLWHEHPPQTFHFAPHLTVFTLRSLSRLLERHGLRVVRSSAKRELQVLAARGPMDTSPASPVEPWGDVERDAFLDRVREWTLAAFGDAGERPRTLAWRKSSEPDALYEREIVATPFAGRLIGAAARGSSGLLGRLARRFAPDYTADPSLRTLPVRVRGEEVLPVVIHHPGQRPPIWVK